MKEFFDDDSLVYSSDNTDEFASRDDAEQDRSSSNSRSAAKNLAYMRQIEIMREHKMLMSSLKDVYEI